MYIVIHIFSYCNVAVCRIRVCRALFFNYICLIILLYIGYTVVYIYIARDAIVMWTFLWLVSLLHNGV